MATVTHSGKYGATMAIQLHGADEIAKTLNTFLPQQAAKLMDRVLWSGASSLAKQCRERAPVGRPRKGNRRVGTGKFTNLKTSIGVRRGKGPSNEIVFYIVARAFYASWVENGHNLVKRKPRRRGPKYSVGRVDGFPFMRTAYDASSDIVLNSMLKALKAGIEKIGKENARLDKFSGFAQNYTMYQAAGEASARASFSSMMQ